MGGRALSTPGVTRKEGVRWRTRFSGETTPGHKGIRYPSRRRDFIHHVHARDVCLVITNCSCLAFSYICCTCARRFYRRQYDADKRRYRSIAERSNCCEVLRDSLVTVARAKSCSIDTWYMECAQFKLRLHAQRGFHSAE